MGQTIVLFALDPDAVRAVFVALTALIAIFLLMGNRLAWAIAFLGSALQFAESLVTAGQYGNLAASGFILGCLLSPPSFRFVWRSPRERSKFDFLTAKSFGAVRDGSYRIFVRLAEWEERQPNASSVQREQSYRVLMWRLGGGCLLLLVLVGVTYSWEQKLDGHNPVVNTLAAITWFGYVLVQLAFIAVVIMATYRHLSENRQRDV